jgi:hypothetical protein
MKKLITYFKNWGPHQWVRVFFGSIFLGAMIAYGFNWALLLFSAIFFIQAFMNWGCNGDAACGINYQLPVKKLGNNNKEALFEEVK